jgi:hypothetical protein
MLLVARIPNQPLSPITLEEFRRKNAMPHRTNRAAIGGDSPPSNPHARVTVTMINPTPLISFLRQGKKRSSMVERVPLRGSAVVFGEP